MARALIVHGGWEGHEPDRMAAVMAGLLTSGGAGVEVSDSLAAFDDSARLAGFDLIVPIWTMGTLSKERTAAVSEAVAAGTGLAGCHGGMCDAFRDNPLWQFMTGAQWVAHPGDDGVRHGVRVVSEDPLVAGLPDFEVVTEQYYLHIDPAVKVHAVTDFPVAGGHHLPNGPVEMPVVFTKFWGAGRVYYNALGHRAALFADGPAREMMRRGLVWAMRGAV